MRPNSQAMLQDSGLRTQDWFRRLAWATAAATYLLIVMGAVVRVTGSGLGCPDWPLCHGRFVPPLETTAIIEYAHRLFGAVVSPLILALCSAAWLTRRRERPIVVPATLVPLLLAVQIGLGAVVVKLELPAMVVLVHLGFAMAIHPGSPLRRVYSGRDGRAPVPGRVSHRSHRRAGGRESTAPATCGRSGIQSRSPAAMSRLSLGRKLMTKTE